MEDASGHADRSGRDRPRGTQRLLVLIAGAAVIIGIGLAVLWYWSPGKEVKISRVESVYYSGQATEQQARALGEALQKAGWFNGERTASAILRKTDEHGTVVSLVTNPQSWQDAGAEAYFKTLGHKIAPAVGGPPFKLDLVDQFRRVKREFQID